MKTNTHVEAGRLQANQNAAQVRDAREGNGLKVKTSVKAGQVRTWVPKHMGEHILRVA